MHDSFGFVGVRAICETVAKTMADGVVNGIRELIICHLDPVEIDQISSCSSSQWCDLSLWLNRSHYLLM